MMNKLIKTVLVSGLVFSAAASAEMAPYVGAEVQLNNPKFNKDMTTNQGSIEAKKGRLGLGVYGGVKATENFGVEVGASFAKKATKKSARNTDVTVKHNNIYVDAVGYMPVNEEVEVLGKVGLGRMKAKVTVANETVTNADKVNKAKVGVRLGAGVQYKLDDNLAARVMLTHQKGNKESLKNNTTVGLGLTWSVL